MPGARRRCFFFAYTELGPRAKNNYDAHCPMEIHGIFVMKDCETARQGAQNLTTRTSVQTPSSTRRALQEAGEDQHFDVGRSSFAHISPHACPHRFHVGSNFWQRFS